MATPVPNYELYGETETSRIPDFLHCERISERSRIHAGEILPHRHDGLLQILFTQQGRIEATLEDRPEAAAGRFAIVVPPLAVHGFRISPDTEGWVVTVPSGSVSELMEAAPRLAGNFIAPKVFRDGAAGLDFETVGGLIARIADEYGGAEPGRYMALQSAVGLLLVSLARAMQARAPEVKAVQGRMISQFARFRTEVERRFRHHESLDTYGRAVGMTPTHLNRVCRAVVGKSALKVLHDRLVIEAKRDLAYSSMAVSEIAVILGFNDPAYFTRFFARETGQSPSAYRREAKTELSERVAP